MTQKQNPDHANPPAHITPALRILLVLCVLLGLAGLALDLHPVFQIEKLPLFYAGFGFLAFVGIIVLGKLLRRWIIRPSDYYDDDYYDDDCDDA